MGRLEETLPTSPAVIVEAVVEGIVGRQEERGRHFPECDTESLYPPRLDGSRGNTPEKGVRVLRFKFGARAVAQVAGSDRFKMRASTPGFPPL